MKPFLLFASAFFLYSDLFAQQNTTAAGGNGNGSGGSVSYSVGQIDYRSTSASGGKISEGVQQAVEIFTVGIEELEISVHIFPNPTAEEVTISLEGHNNGDLTLELYDLSGQLLSSQTFSNSQTILSLSSFPAGTYLLKVISQKNTNTYKIIKH